VSGDDARPGGPDGPSSRPAGERLVLRSGGGVRLTIGYAAVAVLLLGDAAIRGSWETVLRALPWLALVGWLLVAVLVRPCVVARPDGLEVVDVVRRTRVPWDRIEQLVSRFQLRVHLDDGRVVRSWGAPTAGIDRGPRDATPPDARGRFRAMPPLDLVLARWRADHGDAEASGPVVRRFDPTAPAVALLLAGTCALTLVV